ncbi:ABC transporter permease [Streptomyces profundus]|uniref:ABC transporter permease n=1 Tax=Streptomyces profundus TaxID=2867410 RepID=UPI001D169E43|nr:ABC transporter permease [Streptomyces sp. MA3_2.13]UED87876.1 ABC transporter permease [Streptomyces sp. MA3_2.13]
MSASTALLRTEARLFGREPGSVFWILLFPPLLLGVLGLVPGFREANEDFDGRRMVDVYVSVALLASMVVAALQSMPVVLSGYRERGILRRLHTTPARPGALLTAQLVVHAVAVLATAALVLALGRLAFDVPMPREPVGYTLTVLLAVPAALATGALVSAVARTVKAAQALGMTLFFPMLFASGVYLPIPALPDAAQYAVAWTPFGAAALALDEAALGNWPGWPYLGVLVAWTVLATSAAARWFRWE